MGTITIGWRCLRGHGDSGSEVAQLPRVVRDPDPGRPHASTRRKHSYAAYLDLEWLRVHRDTREPAFENRQPIVIRLADEVQRYVCRIGLDPAEITDVRAQ